MKNRGPLLYFAFLLTVGLGLTLTTRPEAPTPMTIAPAFAAEPADLPPLEGTWEGSWTDTLYNVTGSMTLTISKDGDDYFANGTIDVTEIDPTLGLLSGSAQGTSDGTTITGTFECANLGSGTASIGGALKAGGKVAADGSGSGSVGAPLFFGPFVFSGTVQDGIMWGIFDFTNPGGGEGRAVLTNDALPTSSKTWGGLKAGYFGG